MAFLALSLGACDLRAKREQSAMEEFQAAQTVGDVAEARRALQKLVAINDAQPDYWLALAQACIQLQDYGAAFTAFVRAHELDRANPQTLSMLTQLALRASDLSLAETYVGQLELVAPNDPAVYLTRGYIALRRGNIEDATKKADELAAAVPADPSASILRSRILLTQGKSAEAITMLRKRVTEHPGEEPSLRSLLGLYEYAEDWANANWAARALATLNPQFAETRQRLVESDLRTGKVDQAVADTRAGLEVGTVQDATRLLEPWLAIGPSKAVTPLIVEAAQEATGPRRLALIRFLALAQRPDLVARLTQQDATLPVNPSNINANALYGEALAQIGRADEGLQRLNQVLTIDNLNTDALRGRALLRSRIGQHRLAIEDAQKAVAADQDSASGRLLLARIYSAAGNQEGARTTLWNALNDLPANRRLYEALRPLVLKASGPLALKELDEEFRDQRTVQMNRSLA